MANGQKVVVTNLDEIEGFSLIGIDTLLAAVQQPIRRANPNWVRVTCAAAGDYAALDVMSASATADAGRATYVPNLARVNGGAAVIQTIRAKCSEDAVLTSLRLHFFRAEPTIAEVEMDDNAAFDIKTAAGRDNYEGSILLNSFRDLGVAAAASDSSGLQEAFNCALTATGLWMIVTTDVAEANESAAMTIDFNFFVY